VRRGGACALSRSRVAGNELVGVLLHGAGAAGDLTDVLVEKNGLGGVHVSAAAEPRLVRCKVRDNGGTGVMAKTGGSPVLHDCVVAGNRGVGLWFAQEASGLVDKCEVPPPSRTKWTRRVPHPVLIGHAASLARCAATEPTCSSSPSRSRRSVSRPSPAGATAASWWSAARAAPSASASSKVTPPPHSLPY
jgi:hypothetical protein